jgi:hypothetical protein
MHTTKISKPDRAALKNLWDDAGEWIVDTWTRLNRDHFDGMLKYHGVVWGLTPHGGSLGHTYGGSSRRITLHPAIIDPHTDAWDYEKHSAGATKLGAAFAADVLLHEMVHVKLFDAGVELGEGNSHHNTAPWCDEVMRITPQLGLDPVKAAPVKPRRVDGIVRRLPLDGHLSRSDIGEWPHSLRPTGYYTSAGRIRIRI